MYNSIMHELDLRILYFFNQFAHDFVFIDHFAHIITHSKLPRGILFISIFTWLWFKKDRNQTKNREHLTATVAAFFVSMVIVRILTIVLPFRPRPIHDPSLNIVVPYGFNPDSILQGWTSFPSDHAAIFLIFCIGFLFISRMIGSVMLFYTMFFICLPRVFAGLHYPSDIVGSLVLGLLIGISFNLGRWKTPAYELIARSEKSRPEWFYTLFFITLYFMATMFGDILKLMRLL